MQYCIAFENVRVRFIAQLCGPKGLMVWQATDDFAACINFRGRKLLPRRCTVGWEFVDAECENPVLTIANLAASARRRGRWRRSSRSSRQCGGRQHVVGLVVDLPPGAELPGGHAHHALHRHGAIGHLRGQQASASARVARRSGRPQCVSICRLGLCRRFQESFGTSKSVDMALTSTNGLSCNRT